VKIAIVVQRYGATINGGAELHARYIAEHLAPHVEVEVLTTCATDYITWRNDLPAGTEQIGGVTVRRFPVSRERDPAEFGRLSEQVFTRQHAIRDELAWLDAEGPVSPPLLAYIRDQAATFDFFIFFSVRYHHALYGSRLVADKAILVPTAERDGALGLAVFGPVFRGVRALMYNSFEERALIHAVSGNQDVPGVVVGIGSEIPAATHPLEFRRKFKLRERFAIYVGRIDENKGCDELFDFWGRYSRLLVEGMHLVLIGNPVIPIPRHPQIHHVGFVSDRDKFDAIAAAELLIMPSYFESLSMVALEAWALGKPVLANGRCDVLKGQCIRSNGGLYYDNFAEFVEALQAIDLNPSLAAALGRNGREYFARHYAWPVIERKYLDMLARLAGDAARRPAMAPLPGWWARRRNDLAAADHVVARLPTGPALGDRPPSSAVAPPSSLPAAAAAPGPDVPREPASAPRPGGISPRSTETPPRRDSRPDAQRPSVPRASGPQSARHPGRGPHRHIRRAGGRPRRPGGR
jgi:glycosyltransferase involved in cell wall biosynthesis